MRSIKLTAFLLAVIITVPCFFGCTDLVSRFYPYETKEEATYSFTPVTASEGDFYFSDFDGNVISIPSAPERIVSLSVVSTEIICGIGASRYIIGLDSSSANLDGAPINAAVVPYYYMSFADVVALEPDLVFYSSEYISPLTLDALKNTDIKLVRIPGSGNIETAEANIRFISALLFKEEAGSKIVEEMRYEFEKIKKSASLVGVRKKIYIEYMNEFYTCGGDTLLSEICDMAGFENVYADIKGNGSVNASSLLNTDPEIILLVGSNNVNENTVRNRKSIEKVSAVRENKIYAYDISGALRPTQNIVNTAKDIAKLLGTTN